MAREVTVKLDLPGLICEPLPSGNVKFRVRVIGNKAKRITLRLRPGDPDFLSEYTAARAGLVAGQPFARQGPPPPVRGSVSWLAAAYESAMPGLGLDPATIKQRRHFLGQLRDQAGDYSADMPIAELVAMRDARSATPGAADNFVKTVRAMYRWGLDRGMVDHNPAAGVGRINRDMRGAVPWSVADLKQFREKHPPGTMPHLALTLFMFTACRISEAVKLGRENETDRAGITWLDWQPSKKGAKRVQIPILPPLARAIRGMTVLHPKAYLLTDYGRPFASSAAFGNKFRDWCKTAGLDDRSSHGIRKAAGEFLALQGATQYQIMAVHGHASARTSHVYTQGVERATLAGKAMDLLAGMDW